DLALEVEVARDVVPELDAERVVDAVGTVDAERRRGALAHALAARARRRVVAVEVETVGVGLILFDTHLLDRERHLGGVRRERGRGRRTARELALLRPDVAFVRHL